jgi:hypothetical protein
MVKVVGIFPLTMNNTSEFASVKREQSDLFFLGK